MYTTNICHNCLRASSARLGLGLYCQDCLGLFRTGQDRLRGALSKLKAIKLSEVIRDLAD